MVHNLLKICILYSLLEDKNDKRIIDLKFKETIIHISIAKILS